MKSLVMSEGKTSFLPVKKKERRGDGGKRRREDAGGDAKGSLPTRLFNRYALRSTNPDDIRIYSSFANFYSFFLCVVSG